jgi:hypothetical protein
MTLQEVKEKIKIESANPKANEKMLGWVLEPDDCFGRGYDDENKYCKDCTVQADVGGRKEQLMVFCKEICCPPEEQVSEVENKPEPKPEDYEQVSNYLKPEKKPVPKPVIEKPIIELIEKPVKVGKPDKLKEKGGEENMESVKGTTKLIRDMLKEGKSQGEIVTALTPLFVEKGVTEELAKKRIRPLIYRELKKGAKGAEPKTEPIEAEITPV